MRVSVAKMMKERNRKERNGRMKRADGKTVEDRRFGAVKWEGVGETEQ